MLLERASVLAATINSYQELKNTADEAAQFATRAQQFSTISMRVLLLRKLLSELADAGVSVDFKPNDSVGFAAKARQLREEIKANPAKLNDPPFDLKYEFSDRLISIAGAGEKAALAAWKAYVEKRAAFGADDVLTALAQVPQFKASVHQIRQIRSDVAGLGAGFPADPKAAIARLDSLIAQHETAWTTLAASDIPPSVVVFIRAAASGDALLSAFTPDVRSWLDSRNLLDAFRIKLR